jgi:hypothetical protein
MLQTIYHTEDVEGYESGYLDRYWTNGEDVLFVAEDELPSPTTSEMVSTIPKQYSKARSQCHYSVGKPFGILANVVRCALWRREQTPCIFYVPQVLDLLDSWRNPLYTVFNGLIVKLNST